MDNFKRFEDQRTPERSFSSTLTKVSGWTPVNQPSSSPLRSLVKLGPDEKPKKRKSRKEKQTTTPKQSLSTPTKTRKRAKVEASKHVIALAGLDVPKTQASPATPIVRGSLHSQAISTTLSINGGSDRKGLESSKVLPEATSSTQNTLHLPRGAVDQTLSLTSDADRDAQLLAEQEDFSDFGVEDQAPATSDEWFADDDLEDAGPEWLDAARAAEPKSKEAHPQKTRNDAVYDQLVALAESSPPLSQISGNRVKLEQQQIDVEMNGDRLDFEDTEFVDPSAEPEGLHTLGDGLRFSKPCSAAVVNAETSSVKGNTQFQDLQMKPPPKPCSAPHRIKFGPGGVPLPFVRAPFQKPLLNHSPVQGLQNGTVLRTVFRVGEALNVASVASSGNLDAIIELYARVIRSSREDFKQHFLFADLFTDKPPYLKGTYGIWKDVPQWEQDARGFLDEAGQGRMCRVVGRVKRRCTGSPHLNVLSIWECSLEDVGIAKGMVCS